MYLSSSGCDISSLGSAYNLKLNSIIIFSYLGLILLNLRGKTFYVHEGLLKKGGGVIKKKLLHVHLIQVQVSSSSHTPDSVISHQNL